MQTSTRGRCSLPQQGPFPRAFSPVQPFLLPGAAAVRHGPPRVSFCPVVALAGLQDLLSNSAQSFATEAASAKHSTPPDPGRGEGRGSRQPGNEALTSPRPVTTISIFDLA